MPGTVQSTEYEAPPGRWRFASAPPGAGLEGAVVEYWEVEGRLAPFRERILPNGCAEIMVNLGPPHEMITDDGSSIWERAWFSGVHDRAIVIESLNGTHLVSARLHPLGAVALFGAAMAGKVNGVVDLAAVAGPSADDLRAKLLHADSPEQRFELLEEFVRARLGARNLPSEVVRRAVRAIEEAHGNLQISSIHAGLNVSRKHLSMLFAREMGMSPKAYARIQRFVWTLARLRESESVDWVRLANDAGYSDQSHLAREFRRIADASPTEFLRTRSPDSTALLGEPG